MITRKRNQLLVSERLCLRITVFVGLLLTLIFYTSILLRTSQTIAAVPEMCGLESSPLFVQKRILMGIMSADFPNEFDCRQQFRELFEIASHQNGRVCSLGDFLSGPESHRRRCQLVYTFVLGGNPDGPLELVNNSFPLLVSNDRLSASGIEARDRLKNDMTFLNIRENMEQGKTYVWHKSTMHKSYC